ncbi:dopamine beta-hydroxylase-like [Stegodyphus dumicola]|uniref:dopamine beta-hydroxylase-like n=1 Tax=Stegodyphus dumicola TaxID=202533 RepID=UPI0015B3217A|nr:dopamine beta-hydroxylase-like [Stegodyphus dumicola]
MLLRGPLVVLFLFHIEGLRFAAVDNTLSSVPYHEEKAVPYFETTLDQDDKLHLYWTVDYEEETVTFELRVRASDHDWVGVGFSDRGSITNSDLCVLWTDKKRKNQFQDIYTDEIGYVTVDDHDDCQLLSLKRRGYITRYAWSRKFDTCDNQDYYIEDGTTHIVYAMGHGPLRRIDGMNLFKEKHGFQRVQLLKNIAPNPVFPDDAQSLTIHNDKVPVPNVETTYWCSLHRLPQVFENKNHIIQYAAAIQEENQGVVHHMEVFHCEVDANKKLPPWNGPCTSPAKPRVLEACKRVLAAWAMGALPFTYPEEAGLPIGGPGFSRYVMLEVHYNNPELKEGLVDSSGVTLSYTPSLREYDAGVMELGLEYTDKMAIPPHQPDFALTGYCVAECTRAGLPPDGIVIFGSQLHTHLTGTVVYTKHIRGSAELPELNRDNHYSTHFQEIRRLKRKVRILPGDGLLTTCHYSTNDRENITLGGFAISDEMCVNYVHYYPKTNLEVCKSSIDTKVLKSYFRYMNTYNDEDTSDEKTVADNYHSIHWSQNNADFLSHLYSDAPLSMQCNQSSGDRFPGYWNGIPRTDVLYPLSEPKRKCASNMRLNKIYDEDL